MAIKKNAIVGQSGGPTAAINATLCGVIRGALASEKIDTIYGTRYGIQGIIDDNIANLSEIFTDEHSLFTLENTPASYLGSCRVKLPKMEDKPEVYEKIFETFKKYNIGYFFYIGGNDSMDTVAKLSAYKEKIGYDIAIMGVPKTIDNDLIITDHTPGYGSAAKYIASSICEIARDCAVYTQKAVTIVEIMGRDAGWLTCAAALPSLYGIDAVDYVYLPERVFDMEKFFGDIENAFKKHNNIVIAVSEGIRNADGQYVGASTQSGAVDAFGHAYLAGTAKALEYAVKDKFGCKVRSVELNILQRCASHIASDTDLCESVAIGKSAVAAAENGISGKMMIFKRTSNSPYTYEIAHEDIAKIANQIKEVPDEFINEEANFVTKECLEYIAPLIMGERKQNYINGLPEHIIL